MKRGEGGWFIMSLTNFICRMLGYCIITFFFFNNLSKNEYFLVICRPLFFQSDSFHFFFFTFLKPLFLLFFLFFLPLDSLNIFFFFCSFEITTVRAVAVILVVLVMVVGGLVSSCDALADQLDIGSFAGQSFYPMSFTFSLDRGISINCWVFLATTISLEQPLVHVSYNFRSCLDGLI